MKRLLLSLGVLFILWSCTAKRDTLCTVPVLTDYRLYYPDEALERGLEGTVVLRLVVNEDGRTENVEIHQSSGFLLLDSAAVRTAATFIFSPAVMRDKPTRSRITLPVEFKLTGMDFETWITEVKVLQDKIDRSQNSKDIEGLYNLYKRLIYSTRYKADMEVNHYIEDAVENATAELWDGYWSAYPAGVLLFIDIMKRYPDSFTSLRAQVDFKNYMEEEAIRMHRFLSQSHSYTLINRLYDAVDEK
jgi:TonB family protein